MPKSFKFTLLALVVIGVAILQAFFPVKEEFMNLREYFETGGLVPVLVFVLVFVLLNFFFFPTSLLLITAGSAFGIVKGYLIATGSMLISMWLIYMLGQFFLREFILEKIGQKPRLARIVSVIEQKGIPVILLLRISPMVSFSILSYMVSLIKVPVLKYLGASILGLVPPVLMYIYLGAISTNLLSDGGAVNESHQLLKYIGLGVTLIVTLAVARITRKALKDQVGE